MAISIQAFMPEHTEGIAGLIVPIQQNEFGIPITYEAQPDLRDIPGFYLTGGGGFWVAMEGGAVVGCVALKDIGAKQAALRKMFVGEAYRGSDKGVARQLLETALAHACDMGTREIFLGTTAQFLAAHRFYEKNGFQLVDAEALPARFPRMEVDTRFYKLRLDT